MVEKSEFKKSTLAQFVELGGYNIVKQDPETRRWKGIKRASEITKLSDETIRGILKVHSLPPLKTLPKYVDDFYASEGYKLLQEKFGHRRFFKSILKPTAIEALISLKVKILSHGIKKTLKSCGSILNYRILEQNGFSKIRQYKSET